MDELLKTLGERFHRHASAGAEFILEGDRFSDISRKAAGIIGATAGVEGSLCLCTEDKSLAAAALLASLSGGPQIVIPYALSPRGIGETHDAEAFGALLSEAPRELPPGVKLITPEDLKGPEARLEPSRDPDSPFIRLFTGGSTGAPRVWTKTPRNIMGEALHLSEMFSISPEDIILATVPPIHIYGLLFSVAVPLVSGARVVAEICTFPQEILTAVRRRSPTLLVAVPMHYRVLGGTDLPQGIFRLAFSSGGMLDEHDAVNFHRQTACRLVEVYGSTETGGIATRCRADGEEHWTPFESVQCMIAGERLSVRSEFISPGLERDERGFYLTGDRVHSVEGGRFALLGRADGIAKVGGKRVDLAEIRQKLKALPGVRDALVINLPADKGRENEIAALVAGDTDETSIRKALSESLEPYAVPRRIRIVDAIPATRMGKHDRRSIEELLK